MVSDKPAKQMKTREILHQFCLYFLPIALFLACIALLFMYRDMNSALNNLQKSEREKVISQAKLLSSKFHAISTNLHLLSMQHDFPIYLENPNPELLQEIKQELLLFSEIKDSFNRVELVNADGFEIAAVQKDNTTFSVVPELSKNSIKEDRCFQNTLKLPRGVIMTSSLSCEYHSVTLDEMPLLRYSTPIVNRSGSPLGILELSQSIDVFIDELQTLSTSAASQSMLVSSEGLILGSTILKDNGPISQETPLSDITTLFPEEWHEIENNESGQLMTDRGLFTYETIFSLQQKKPAQLSKNAITDTPPFLWKEISFMPQTEVKMLQRESFGRILFSYLLALLLLAVCAFALSCTAVRRKKAEQDVREKAEELRAINEAAANAIIAVDSNSNIAHWNPAAERLFQYTSEEAVEISLTELITPAKHASSFSTISKKLDLSDIIPSDTRTIELYGCRKDGSRFPVEVSFSSFKRDNQWHTVGIFRDISRRRAMEKEVLRANKFESLSVLSGGIAHDFNNILTAILGNINLVGKLPGTSQDSIELLKNAEKASRRARALTQQLLTFSKDGVLIRKITSLNPLIHEATEFALYGSSVVSSFSIPDNLLLVNIDATQIIQVIRNIVTNARQSITGPGAINIICRNISAEDSDLLPDRFSGDYIEIAIHDTGAGIPNKLERKIFEPYFTTKEHRSGLGLTIAHAIIKRHDGFLTYFSQENIGTTFYVFLPAAVDQHLPREKEKAASKGNHFRILVIDDEEMLLNITSRMLVHLGHECVTAKSAREALEIYRHLWKTGAPVDGIITDLTLSGGMGGKETAGAIFDINSEARIIVSSGYANDPVMVDYDEYGFCAAIAKPFNMDELETTINEVLA